jgi:hypothetical protein
MTNPSRNATPVARTPKTPDAPSPSVKNPSSGAPRRTSRSAAIATAVETATRASPQTTLTLYP